MAANRGHARRNWSIVIAVGVAIALFITLFSPFASSHPDGLERVAEDKSFIHSAEGSSYEIIPDYTFPGVENERLATVLSGVVGVLIVTSVGLGIGYWMKRAARANAAREAASAPTTAGPGR